MAALKHWERPAALAKKGRVGECKCGHGSIDHGRRKSPGSPMWDVTACRVRGCKCSRYANRDGSAWPFGVGP